MKRCIHVLTLVVCMTLVFTVRGNASISGTVTDTQCNPVAGALVTFTDEADPGRFFTAYTDESGYYEIDLNVTAILDNPPVPFSLGQNYPNPFNPSTTIPFTLDMPAHVSIVVYNVLGQKVAVLADIDMSAGSHTRTWNGTDSHGNHVSAGIYLYQLNAGGYAVTKKLLLLDGGAGIIQGSATIAAAGKSAVQVLPTVTSAQNNTYTVAITHAETVPYEGDGIIAHDGEVLGFIVERLTDDQPVIEGIAFVTIPELTTPYNMSANFSVTLSSYEISTTVVTNALYARYLADVLATGNITATSSNVTGASGDWSGQIYLNMDNTDCKIHFSEGSFAVDDGMENHPVVEITWYGAKAFAEYYGLDLPTEAEWQYAASGGEGYLYGTDDGSLSSDKGNYDRNVGHTTDVGNYPANPFGLYDMAGNVWEWTHDWYSSYPEGTEHDYTGASTGVSRVIRGGMWDYGAFYSRVDHRSIAVPGGGYYVGFRVVRRTYG